MSNDNYTPKYSSDDPDRIEEALPDAPSHDTEIPVDTNDPGLAAVEVPEEVAGDDAAAYGRGEGVGEGQDVKGLSQGQIVWSRFIRHKGAIFGLITTAVNRYGIKGFRKFLNSKG